MRIQRLSLDNFGHFANKTLDFGSQGGVPDFHIIYGPNEAGKTTIMEGYLRLLYGFLPKEPYAFRHERKNLMVSGTLEIDGIAKHFKRLPTKTNNLRGDNNNPVTETAITSTLGGFESEDDYRALFCLDDETIEKGGEDIARADTNVGRLLFSGASGVANENAIIDDAQSECSDLFKKGGSVSDAKQTQKKLKGIDVSIRENMLDATAWKKLKEACETAEAQKQYSDEVHSGLIRTLSLKRAMKTALPNLREADELQVEILEYEGYPDPTELDKQVIDELTENERNARKKLNELQSKINHNENESENLEIDEKLLAITQRLQELDASRSRAEAANQNLPENRRDTEDKFEEMSRIGRGIGLPKNSDITTLVKSTPEIANLQRLFEAQDKASTAKEKKEEETAKLRSDVAGAEKKLKGLQDDAPAQVGLTEQLRRFNADDIVHKALEALRDIKESKSKVQVALERLSLNGKVFKDLPTCQIEQTKVNGLVKDYDDLNRRLADARTESDIHGKTVSVQNDILSNLPEDIADLTDAKVKEACDRRDHLWRKYRANLDSKSADAFDSSMKKVDAIYTSRVANATRLATLHHEEFELIRASARQKAAIARVNKLENKAAKIESEVNKIAAKSCLPTVTPAQFQDWIERHGDAAKEKENLDNLYTQHKETLEKRAKLCEVLLPVVDLEAPSDKELLTEAHRLAQQEQEHLNQVKEVKNDLRRLNKNLEDRLKELADLEKADERAQSTFSSGVQHLFGGSLADNIWPSAFEELRNIQRLDLEHIKLKQRAGSLITDQQKFGQEINVLRVEFTVDETDDQKVFHALKGASDRANMENDRLTRLTKELAEYKTHKTNTMNELTDIQLTVKGLGKKFPATAEVDTLDKLTSAVGKASAVAKKKSRLKAIERQLFSDFSVDSLDSVREKLNNLDPHNLEAQIKTLDADRETAYQAASEASIGLGAAKNKLEAINGDAKTAELIEEQKTLQLELQDTLLKHLELDFGLRLAREALRRYRDENRSGMLNDTQNAFSELTSGAYKKLITRPEGKSEEILLALDNSGRHKRIPDMSKGTRFQLFLALRAAAYKQMATQGTQVPFFCDDIFETFDEDRTRAACRLMEGIGQSGQAIYLTHHIHVLEIAKEICKSKPIIHRI